MASNNYKTGYDSRIEDKLNFFANNQISLFKDSINAPIRYHNTQINVWGSSHKFLFFWESHALSEDDLNKLKLNELEIS